MLESRYLKAFQHLRKNRPEAFKLLGDVMFVEELPHQETRTASGIEITGGGAFRHDGQEVNKALLCFVLDKGDGFYDTDGNDVPPKCAVGDVVLLPRLSVNWLSNFGPIVGDSAARFGWSREIEVKAAGSIQEFEEAMKLLAEGLNTSIEDAAAGGASHVQQ